MPEAASLFRQWRTKRGLTQEALAVLLGKGQSTISNWDRGKGGPDMESARIIQQEFGTPLDFWCSGEAA